MTLLRTFALLAAAFVCFATAAPIDHNTIAARLAGLESDPQGEVGTYDYYDTFETYG